MQRHNLEEALFDVRSFESQSMPKIVTLLYNRISGASLDVKKKSGAGESS
jgi:hypothetical protein